MYTPKYVELLEQRRTQLRDQLAGILPAAGSFVWEVGCGHGHFLTAYAAAHPDRLCLGIDLIGERIERANRKRERARLPNVHFVQAEARLFLEVLPPDVRIGTVFVLFPDPWPKLRHKKHRILQPDFLQAVARKADPGCRLLFRTDFQPYFESAREALAASPEWELAAEPWPFESVTVFQERAETFHSLVARRRPVVVAPLAALSAGEGS